VQERGDVGYSPLVSDDSLPFLTRLWFAWVCSLRVLFDGAFAKRVYAARLSSPASAPTNAAPAPTKAPEPPSDTAALQLLALLQREGRLVDFLEQDVAAFSDAEIGAAARVVHDGCRKALRAHAAIDPVRAEDEGATVTIAAGFAASEVKLTGNVRGAAPYTGVVRHRGWRAKEMKLPATVEGHDATVLAPAEIEIA
jgi:hypothetical protein